MMTTGPGKKARRKLTVNLSEKTHDQIHELMAELHYSIYADVVERAIDYFHRASMKRKVRARKA